MRPTAEAVLIDSIDNPERTFVLTSTPADKSADAPVGARYTAFSGTLIDVLRRGSPNGPELLDMELIFGQPAARLRNATAMPSACGSPGSSGARRDGELDQAAHLAVRLLAEMRAQAGFSSDDTWEVERVYRKVLKRLGGRKAFRVRLRSASSTAWSVFKENW